MTWLNSYNVGCVCKVCMFWLVIISIVFLVELSLIAGAQVGMGSLSLIVVSSYVLLSLHTC